VRAAARAPWLPVYTAIDATKDRSFLDRCLEMGLGTPQRGGRFPPLRGVSFSGGQQQTSAEPIFSVLLGRGRFSRPVWSVPKAAMFKHLRALVGLGLVKFAP
jgi:hypothetical protein